MSNAWDKKESDDRKTKFLKEYEEISKKHSVRLMAYPTFVPTGEHGFSVAASMLPIDLKETGVPSPLSKEDVIK